MTVRFPARNVISEKDNSAILLLLMFLTGILMGTALVRHFDFLAAVFPGVQNQEELQGFINRDFLQIFLSCGKFLVLIYLLGFQKWGAVLVPPVFGLEGIYFGGTVSSLVALMGGRGVVMAILLQLFRLVLMLPFGFLLGGWSVRQSLQFSASDSGKNRIGVLVVTLCVMALTAFLDCSLSRWLGGMYFLRFGV